MDTDSLYLAITEKNCMILYEVRKIRSGDSYAAKSLMVRSVHTLAEISFRGCLSLITKTS